MRKLIGLLGLLPGMVMAAPLVSQDFAYALPLQLDGDGAIYRLALPETIYRDIHRHDLGDMRVFNGHAQVVPHLLKRPTPVISQQAVSEPLPLFPLEGRKPREGSGEMAIHIRTDEYGAIVDLRRQGQPSESPGMANYYLIDASLLDGPFEQLILRWPQGEENFILPLELEASDDLSQWRRVPGQHQLAHLRHDGQQILHDTLKLSGLQARYLRLSWPLAALGLPLETASLGLQTAGLEQHFSVLSLAARAGEEVGEYLFDSSGHFPVERVQLSLPEDNTVVPIILASRAAADQAWQTRYRGLVYRLGGLHSESVALSPTSDRFWRVQVGQEGGGLGNGLPQLQLGWLPHQLYFVARGESPFMLAYGAVAVEPQQPAGMRLMQQLLNSQQEALIKPARHSEPHLLGGVSRLEPPAAPLPWRKWLLWGVLLLGVLILFGMAWQLSRQLQSK